MSFMTKLAVAMGAAGAGVILYAQRRGVNTGRDVGAVLLNLPEELKETRGNLERLTRKAIQAGKQAAARKEAEIDRQLAGEEAPPPVQDYVV